MSRADRALARTSGRLPRVGPLKTDAFKSRLHQERMGTILGVALGVMFGVCFVTGIFSHVAQHPPSWFVWPASPSWFYRFTQGLHVTLGLATIPVVLVKLWTVYPRLYTFPPVESVAHLVERISLVPLVGGSLFLLFSGVASITRWNPIPYSFPVAHWTIAWVTIGALLIHVAAKAPVFGPILRGRAEAPPEVPEDGGMSRRGLLTAAFGTAGVLALVTVGQTVRQLEWLGLLAPRKPSVGPQGFPVNKSAAAVGVTEAATDPGFRLQVLGSGEPLSLSLDDLRAMPQHEVALPITCVDGWSAMVSWKGVKVADLLALAGADEGSSARVRSLQDQSRPNSSAELTPDHAWNPNTLLALEANGGVLDLDHGYPLRLIGPNRPGVLATKWVNILEVI